MPLGIRIRKDVRGVKQFVMPKATEGALPVIRIKNSLPKCALVKPHPCDSGCVPTASQFLFVASEELSWLGVVSNSEMSRIIHRNGKRHARAIVSDDEHGPGCNVLSFGNAVKINQRQSLPHCESQADVVPVIRVSAAISVLQEPVGTEFILVGIAWRGEDRDRCY